MRRATCSLPTCQTARITSRTPGSLRSSFCVFCPSLRMHCWWNWPTWTRPWPCLPRCSAIPCTAWRSWCPPRAPSSFTSAQWQPAPPHWCGPSPRATCRSASSAATSWSRFRCAMTARTWPRWPSCSVSRPRKWCAATPAANTPLPLPALRQALPISAAAIPASTCRAAVRRARVFPPAPWAWRAPSAACTRKPARAAGRSSGSPPWPCGT
ncbi:hypothetical protein D9M72_364790 [compost metagenome]